MSKNYLTSNSADRNDQDEQIFNLAQYEAQNFEKTEITKLKEDIINQISSVSLPDKEKALILKQKLEQLKVLSNKQLKKIIGRQIFQTMSNLLTNCSSESEKVIIDIIEMLIKRGIRNKRMNIFFKGIKYSGLFDKIESLIIDKIQIEEQQNNCSNIPYSGLVEKLIIMYIGLMKNKDIQLEMQIRCTKVIDRSVTNIFGSCLLSDQEKEIQAQSILEDMKNKNNAQLKLMFDKQVLLIIKLRLGNCATSYEMLVLDIIDKIIDHITLNQKERQQYFSDYQQTGIIQKIESLIYEKVQLDEKENENQLQQIAVEQLLRVYFKIMKNKEINFEILNRFAQVINRSVINIFGSCLLSEQEKEIQTKAILENIKNICTNFLPYTLPYILNLKLMIIFQKHLGDCNTSTEKVILDIIEYIINNKRYYLTNIIKQSALQIKIESLLSMKIEQEEKDENNLPFSNTVEQLVRVYFNIMNWQKESDVGSLDKCIRVLERNISNILKRLINNSNNDKGILSLIENKNKQFENELKGITQMIQILGQFKLLLSPHDLYYRIPQQIQKVIIDKVSLILHLNCNAQLHCPLNIIVHQTPEINELYHIAFQTIINASINNSDLQKYLVDNHNIFSHISSILNSFINSNSYHLKVIEDKQQSESNTNTSLTSITDTLQLLYYLIIRNNDHIIQTSSTPNMISALIKLYIYKIRNQISDDGQYKIQQFRTNYTSCLDSIKNSYNPQIYSQLFEFGYLQALIMTIRTTKKSEMENYLMNFYQTLNDIEQFILILRNKEQNSSNVSQLIGLLSVYEQFEEEGVNEEIEAHLNNKNCKFHALHTKNAISNCFKHHQI